MLNDAVTHALPTKGFNGARMVQRRRLTVPTTSSLVTTLAPSSLNPRSVNPRSLLPQSPLLRSTHCAQSSLAPLLLPRPLLQPFRLLRRIFRRELNGRLPLSPVRVYTRTRRSGGGGAEDGAEEEEEEEEEEVEEEEEAMARETRQAAAVNGRRRPSWSTASIAGEVRKVEAPRGHVPVCMPGLLTWASNDQSTSVHVLLTADQLT